VLYISHLNLQWYCIPAKSVIDYTATKDMNIILYTYVL